MFALVLLERLRLAICLPFSKLLDSMICHGCDSLHECAAYLRIPMCSLSRNSVHHYL